MDRIKSDDRFSYVLKDPRFRHVPKHERKVKIDKRFAGMFNDKRFKLKSTVDKRGRPVNYSTKEDLKKFYELSSSEVESSDSEEEKPRIRAVAKHLKKGADGSDDVGGTATETVKHKEKKKKLKSSNKKSLVEKVKIKQNVIKSSHDSDDGHSLSNSEEIQDDVQESDDDGSIDIARGEGNEESSDTDEEGSSGESEDEGVSHPWGELIQDAPETKEITRRLAVCNMDWDRIKAQDLFTLLHSFKPPEGIIKHVKIYLSDFGKERLQEEELKGPAELVSETVSDEEQDGDVEGSKFHMEKLRKYQLNRLRYYYTVVECDSPETANKIYEECDGIEYESSATRVDLRFIPADMVFDEKPVSMADSLPDPSVYRPNLFVTAALQQAKVNLTWDETDPDRIKATQRAFDKNELAKMDLSAYLASSGSDDEVEDGKPVQRNNFPESDEESEAARISKYRALLQSIESEETKKKDQDVELEITWEPGLREATEKLVKKKQQVEETVTPWEQYLQKRKEKKQKKREEKKKSEVSLSSEQASGNPYSDDELPSDVDLQDPYFQEELGKEFKSKTQKRKPFDKMKPTVEDEQKKAELELLLMNDDDHSKSHFSLKSMLHDDTKNTKKKKNKKKGKPDQRTNMPEDNFEVNVEDKRFAALYTSHLYNVDPSDPQFQKTKGMEKIIEEKLRRHATGVNDEPSTLGKKARLSEKSWQKIDSPTDHIELSMLVKSVKNKTQNFKRRKEK